MSEIPLKEYFEAQAAPPIDPTTNVIALNDAANQRQDDLRNAERRYNNLRSEFSEKIAIVRETHQQELSAKESSRLDSIRQVDREEVNKTAVQAQQAITTLANSTIVLKDTLQAQVAATALAVENRQAIFASEVNKRISQLELQYSEGKGKSGVRDPALDDLVKVVSQLAAQKSEGTGQQNMLGWIVAGVFLLIGVIGAVIGVATFLRR